MILTTITRVTFSVPDEREDAEQFEEQNPDWDKNVTSEFIMFSRTVWTTTRSKDAKMFE